MKLLDIYEKLQSLFNQVRGEWQVGDWYWDVEAGRKIFVDRMIGGALRLPNQLKCKNNFLWLPPLDSDEQPERSLLGMSTGDYKELYFNVMTGKWCFRPNQIGNHYYADTPTEAVLYALIAQEGL